MSENQVGRPKVELTDNDWKKIIGMIQIQCTAVEICGVFGISEDTLGRRIKETEWLEADNFAELYKKHQHEGRASLRRAQWKAAQDGNSTMLVWLGKQVLGQRDKHDLEVAGNPDKPLAFKWKD